MNKATDASVRDGLAEARVAWPVLLMSLGAGLVWFANTAIGIALPSIAADFGVGLAQAQWTVTTFTVTMASLLIVGGRLGDTHGYRKVFLIGIAIFATGALVSGIAPSFWFLVIGQVVMGVGGALMLPSTLSIIYASVGFHQRGIAIGVWAAFVNFGFAMGPVIGGTLTSALGWRWIYLLTVPVLVLMAVLTVLKIRESRGIKIPLDYIGVALLGLCLVAMVISLSLSSTLGWAQPQIVIPLSVSILLLAGFVFWERRCRAPLVRLEVFRDFRFSTSITLNWLSNAGIVAFSIFTPLYLTLGLGYPTNQVALMFIPNSIVMTVSPLVAGRLLGRIGVRWPLFTGLLTMGIGVLLLGLAGSHANYWTELFPAFVLIGFGNAFVLTSVSVGALNAVETQDTGMAAGILKTSSMIGSTFGTAAVGSLFFALFRPILDSDLDAAHVPLHPDQLQHVRGLAATGILKMEDLAGFPGAVANMIMNAVRLAFCSAFSLVSIIIAGLFAMGIVMGLAAFRPTSGRGRGHRLGSSHS